MKDLCQPFGIQSRVVTVRTLQVFRLDHDFQNYLQTVISLLINTSMSDPVISVGCCVCYYNKFLYKLPLHRKNVNNLSCVRLASPYQVSSLLSEPATGRPTRQQNNQINIKSCLILGPLRQSETLTQQRRCYYETTLSGLSLQGTCHLPSIFVSTF